MPKKPTLKVVEIRDGAPAVNNIPEQLRALADAIESGAYPNGNDMTNAESVYCVVRFDDAFIPAFFAWGAQINPDRYTISGIFQHCSMLALTDKDDD